MCGERWGFFAVVCLFGVALIAEGVGAESEKKDHSPEVNALLEVPAKGDFPRNGDYQTGFFKTLTKLTQKQGLNPKDYLVYRSRNAWAVLTEGEAIEMKSGQKRYIIVILTAPHISRPGLAVKQLILLNEQGRFLDKTACCINSRYGELKIELSKQPEKQDTQLVVRFHSWYETAWHNWHTISYRGKAYTFRAPLDDSSEWLGKGLCRIAIRDERFLIVFPGLERASTVIEEEKDTK